MQRIDIRNTIEIYSSFSKLTSAYSSTFPQQLLLFSSKSKDPTVVDLGPSPRDTIVRNRPPSSDFPDHRSSSRCREIWSPRIEHDNRSRDIHSGATRKLTVGRKRLVGIGDRRLKRTPLRGGAASGIREIGNAGSSGFIRTLSLARPPEIVRARYSPHFLRITRPLNKEFPRSDRIQPSPWYTLDPHNGNLMPPVMIFRLESTLFLESRSSNATELAGR